MNFSDMVYKDYLKHYGVIGMKWGIRRYQNPDGTLTAAGKDHYVSRRTKRYERKAEKARSKGNEAKAAKYDTYANRSRTLDKYNEELYREKAGYGNAGRKFVTNLFSMRGNNTWREYLAVAKANKNGGQLTLSDKAEAWVSQAFTGRLGLMIDRNSYIKDGSLQDAMDKWKD